MTRSALQRFFSNDCTAAERRDVVQWLLHPANDFQVKEWMKENWDFIAQTDFAGHPDNPDIEMLWQRIRQQIQPPAGSAVPLIPDTKRNFFSRFRPKHYAAAAVIAVLVLSSCCNKKALAVKRRQRQLRNRCNPT